jgi:uncharacterized membrane protein YciS (DUF1049 family)
LRRILRWVIWLPVAIIVISFAVANRQWTRLSLDPFSSTSPFLTIEMPLWLLFIVGVFIGLIVGWMMCWFAQGRHRKLARDRAKDIVRLQSELETVKDPAAVSRSTELSPFIGIGP